MSSGSRLQDENKRLRGQKVSHNIILYKVHLENPYSRQELYLTILTKRGQIVPDTYGGKQIVSYPQVIIVSIFSITLLLTK